MGPLTTTSSTTTTATSSTSLFNDTQSLSEHDAPAQWKCNTCYAAFSTSALQREHMKSEWHIYNLKRRLAELSPLEWEIFESQVLPELDRQSETDESHHRHSVDGDFNYVDDSDGDSYNEEDGDVVATSCLFCNYRVPQTTTGSTHPDTDPSLTLLTHMQTAHSFFIPHLSSLTSLPTFLNYLTTLVHAYHECLCCGAVRGSREAVQQHMRSRGHCVLDFKREPELWGFWEESVAPEFAGVASSEENATPVLLAGGRSRARDAAMKARAARIEKALLRSGPVQCAAEPSSCEASPASQSEDVGALLRSRDARHTPTAATGTNRQLSRRSEQGMLGIPLQQRRTLMAVEKQAQQGAQVRANAEAWGRERCANKQKHYRAAGPMRPNG